MKRCIFVAPVLFFAVALPFGKCFAQSKEEKAIQAAETIYETGDYKKAQASLDKFKKKTFKKLGPQNQYTPTYFLLTAKYNLGAGMLLDFESNLKTAVSSSISINRCATVAASPATAVVTGTSGRNLALVVLGSNIWPGSA